jgi:hypothetical protein
VFTGRVVYRSTSGVFDSKYPVLEEYAFDEDESSKTVGLTKVARNSALEFLRLL